MDHGYEPSRISNLRQQSRWAVGALDGIHSRDPAAAEAMTAVAGLKSVIADAFIPATTTIEFMDPLGGSGTTTDWLQINKLRPTSGSPYERWMEQQFPSDPYGGMSDDELLEELDRLQLEGLPVDDRWFPDMDDPFWGEFEPLAEELARRAGTDKSFADRLAQNASELVLIPFAVGVADFDPAVVANMVLDVFERPQFPPNIENNFRAYGAELLLTFLAGHPEVALETLADPVDDRGEVIEFFEQMLLWPSLDQGVVAEFLDAAMAAPFAPPRHHGLLLAAGNVLQDMVELSNGRSFPDGFRPELSPTLAKIVVQYLPFFVTSLDGSVHLKGFDFDDLGVSLGDHEEAVDLFGALMRDPVAIIVLEQAIITLSALSTGDGGPLAINRDDIANYSLLLREAAENEQVEEALEAADDRRTADLAIDLTFGAIDLITTALGPAKVAGVDIPIDLIESGARAFAEWAITATDLGLDDVPTITALLVVLGMAATVVGAREENGEDDETAENIQLAEETMREIEEDLASGTPIDEINGRVEDLARVIAAIDGDVKAFLNDPRVALPEYDVDAHADTEE